MMNQQVKAAMRPVLFVLALIWLAGCASPSQPSRFYRLESTSPAIPMPQPVMPGATLPIVGIGAVELAGYLDRPQIVERTSPYRLQLYEFDRWAGTLQENVVHLLSEVLQGALAGEAQVVAYPWHSAVRPDFELALSINRFERQQDRVRLDATWTLVAQPQGRLVKLGRQPLESNIDGQEMEAAVAAASRVLERLGEELAREFSPLLNPRH